MPPAWVALRFLILFGCGGLYLTLALRHGVVAGQDSIAYLLGSRDLVHYDSAFHPPFYSVAIALFRFILRDEFLAAKLVSVVAAVVTLGGVDRLARSLFEAPGVGALAMLLLGLSTPFIQYSFATYSDMLATSLVVTALVAAIAETMTLRRGVVVGVLLGLAYLTRYHCLVVALATVGTLGLASEQSALRKARWLHACVVLVAFVATVAPWTGICLYRHGHLNNFNHVNIVFAMHDSMDNWNEFERLKEQYPTAWSVFAAEPDRVSSHLFSNLRELRPLVYDLMPIPAWLCLAGLFSVAFGSGAASRNADRTSWPMGSWKLGHTLLVAVTIAWAMAASLAWWEERFLLPILACCCLFASAFIGCGVRWVTLPVWLRLLGAGAALYSVLSVTYEQFPSVWARLQPDEERRAGEFLRERARSSGRVVASSEIVTYYAHRSHVALAKFADVTPDAVLSRTRELCGDYFVYSRRHSTKEAPQLEYLLDPSDPLVPSQFTLLFRLEAPWPIVVYELSAPR